MTKAIKAKYGIEYWETYEDIIDDLEVDGELGDLEPGTEVDTAFGTDQIYAPLIHLSELCEEEPDGFSEADWIDVGVTSIEDLTPSMFQWLEEMLIALEPDEIAAEFAHLVGLTEQAAESLVAHYRETGGYVESEPERVVAYGFSGPNRRWTRHSVSKSAIDYATRADWARGEPTAYQTALKNGWADDPEITGHMERVDGHDNDAVYGWKVITAPDDVDMPAIGKHLIKFGVTSQKLKDTRVRDCAKKNDMTYELIAICDTSEGDARAFEGLLLGMGKAANMPDWIDGKTEFVVMSDEQLDDAMDLLGMKGAQAEAA